VLKAALGAWPEPLRLALKVPAVVTTLKAPERATAEDGVNETEIVQVAPLDKVAGHVVDA
jgi:hypothetical protein